MKDYAAKPLTKNMATKTGATICDTIAAIVACLSTGALFGALLTIGFFL